MPYRVDLRSDLDLVVAHFRGDISQHEIETALTEVPRMEGFRANLDVLIDFRGCTTAMGWWQVRQLAAFARQRERAWGHSKWAILVSSDLVFGLVRIFIAFANQGDVKSQVFRDAPTAFAWLKAGGDAAAILDALAVKLAADEAPAPSQIKSGDSRAGPGR